MSFKALLLAPLVVPLVFGVVWAVGAGGEPFAGLFFGFVIAALVVYPATLFAFAPALFLLSSLTRPTGPKVALLGLLLGLLSYLPITFEAYMASGPNSGPPEGTYWEMLVQWGWTPFILILGAAGLVTATAYWLLAKRFEPGR